MNRRDFIGGVAAGAVAAGLSGVKQPNVEYTCGRGIEPSEVTITYPAVGDYLIYDRSGKYKIASIRNGVLETRACKTSERSIIWS